MAFSHREISRGALAALVWLALASHPAWSASLPDTIDDSLVLASRPDSPVSATLATILAIEERPDLVSGIVERSVSLSPEKAADIAGAAARAYPRLASEIVIAARSAAPEQTRAIDAATADIPNVQPPPDVAPDDIDEWEAEFEAGGSRTTGNTRTESVNLGLVVEHESDDWENRLKADFSLARTDNETDSRRFETELRTRNNFTERTYVFGVVDYVDDAFSGYEYQLSQNAGFGYQVIDQPQIEWDIETGPGFRVNKFEDTNRSETEVTWRIAEILRWDISESAELSNETSITFGRETTLTQSETALTTDITDTLAARLSFEVRNNSSPPPDRRSTDTTTKAAIVYRFLE